MSRDALTRSTTGDEYETPTLARGRRHRPRVLVVDPDRDTRVILERVLRHAGYRCLLAADAEEALALARRERVRVVITDLYLAARGERCLTRALRGEPRLAGARVLVYTTFGSPGDHAWATAGGCDRMFVKPRPLTDLIDAVNGLASTSH
jgi:CheY-like chemotaxis protein